MNAIECKTLDRTTFRAAQNILFPTFFFKSRPDPLNMEGQRSEVKCPDSTTGKLS